MENPADQKVNDSVHESPKRLTLLAFLGNNSDGNSLLHCMVLENLHRKSCAMELYWTAVFRSLSGDLPVNCYNEEGYTALHIAATIGKHDIIERMLSCIQNLDANVKTKNGEAALHLAVDLGHRDIINTLLLKGANIEEEGYAGMRPLHYAIRRNNKDVVQLLLGKEINVNGRDKSDRTPLFFCKSTEIAEMLISKGADINAKMLTGNTPLHQAALLTDAGFLRPLLEQGAEIEVLNNDGMTPLHFAALYGQHESVQVLILHGANRNAKDLHAETPLHLAVRNPRNIDVVKVLLRCGANVDSCDHLNITPLMRIFYYINSWNFKTYHELIRLFVSNGADIHALDILGKSPSSISEKMGIQSLLEC